MCLNLSVALGVGFAKAFPHFGLSRIASSSLLDQKGDALTMPAPQPLFHPRALRPHTPKAFPRFGHLSFQAK